MFKCNQFLVLILCAAINYGFLIMIMLPFSLIGRYFYRRKSDGSGCAGEPLRDMEKLAAPPGDAPGDEQGVEMKRLATSAADSNDNVVAGDFVNKPQTPRWDV